MAWAGVAAVVGGREAAPGEWPDAVALVSGGERVCSGVLIAPDAVLTAAHCDPDTDSVRIGAVDWREGRSVAVVDRTPHPQGVDVAVLRLAAPVAEPVRPIARGCALAALVDNAPVTVAGWGATSTDATEATDRLHVGDTRIRSVVCDDPAVGCNGALSPDQELRAGGDGIDACIGDSGGPLYLLERDGAVLVGITSRGELGSRRSCGDGGIFSRVDRLRPWLEEDLGLELAAPGCALVPHAPAPPGAVLEVPAGGVGWVWVAPGDPDPGDAWTWRIVDGPARGEAWWEPGGLLAVRIDAPSGHGDAVDVEVVDAAGLTGEARVEVWVVAPSRPRGCLVTTGRASWWTLLVFGLLRRRVGLVAVAACGPTSRAPSAAPASEVEAAPRTIASLWEEPPAWGASVQVGPARVASAASAVDGGVLLQDPITGDGLFVLPGARLQAWPPAEGVDVALRLVWAGSRTSAVAYLATEAEVVRVGAGAVRVVSEPLAPRAWTVGRWTVVMVTSDTDPAGYAASSVGRLRDRFGVGLPGPGSFGGLVAVVTADGDLAPRYATDWLGASLNMQPAQAELAAVRAGAFPDGARVVIEATQVVGWSPDLRWTALQDATGRGLWVDAAGFGVGGGGAGVRGRWTAEVRRDGAVVYLRVWSAPEVLGAGPVVPGSPDDDGAWVEVTADPIDAPDRLGERRAGPWLLDDRLGPIDGLHAPAQVQAVVWRRGDDHRLVVIPP